jgi:hypothetical protein
MAKNGICLQTHEAEGGDIINDYALKSGFFAKRDGLWMQGRKTCRPFDPYTVKIASSFSSEHG